MPKIDQYVQVYINLHKGCLSVQNRKRLVIDHVDRAIIRDAEFWVSEAGRQRVLEEQCKNVHAKVRGSWCDPTETDVSDLVQRVTYNPYKYETFVYADTEESVEQADLVVLEGKRVFI